ncbi:hypothetical protein [Micromonospora sp. b486]|uniref:hypothetical protein n=1 Tax=Micromonospora sp. b486 TaxID=3053986 RepID=UPI00259D1FFB|nr:hypothetical protein [Micromonospora sp. b486]MDM4784547.1 hypothetical protein [Micromonospora sp. b486]
MSFRISAAAAEPAAGRSAAPTAWRCSAVPFYPALEATVRAAAMAPDRGGR